MNTRRSSLSWTHECSYVTGANTFIHNNQCSLLACSVATQHPGTYYWQRLLIVYHPHPRKCCQTFLQHCNQPTWTSNTHTRAVLELCTACSVTSCLVYPTQSAVKSPTLMSTSDASDVSRYMDTMIISVSQAPSVSSNWYCRVRRH